MPLESAPTEVRFQAASDQSLLIYFGDEISLPTHHRIAQFLKLLAAYPIAGTLNLQPAYTSALVKFDARVQTHDKLAAAIRELLPRIDEVKLPAPRVREIPVCYGGEHGPDLNEVARLHGISVDDVVHLHATATYTVYFLGFVPGFAYLGGLPEQLATPRLATPRRSVPAGSVAIGGNQTGVYPTSTPGGWRLIGKTPLKLFNPSSPHASFLELGDEVRFVPISANEFDELAAKQK
jgi:inhibitor of KinA